MIQTDMFSEIPIEVQRRFFAAATDPQTSPCAKAVLVHLWRAAGRDRAVSIETMQQAWRQNPGYKVYSDREIKAAVKELLEERSVPVGSARSAPAGYFLLCSPEDIGEAERPLVGEIRSLARRLRAVNAKSEISRVLCGQLGLE